MEDATKCPECSYPVAEHVGRKACLPAAPPKVIRGIYDLPIFGWAWAEDAKDIER